MAAITAWVSGGWFSLSLTAECEGVSQLPPWRQVRGPFTFKVWLLKTWGKPSWAVVERPGLDRAQRRYEAIRVLRAVVPEAALPVRSAVCWYFFPHEIGVNFFLLTPFPAFRWMDVLVFRWTLEVGIFQNLLSELDRNIRCTRKPSQ